MNILPQPTGNTSSDVGQLIIDAIRDNPEQWKKDNYFKMF